MEKKQGTDQKGHENCPAPDEPLDADSVFFFRKGPWHGELLTGYRTHLEYRHVHGNDHKTYRCPEEHHQHGFKH